MATEAQLAANQANAQLSTVPTSPEGKWKASHNAVKTGLTGQTVLLPTDNVAAYEAHVARHKLADLYPEVTDPAVRASLIEGEIQFAYKKEFANLSLQESRLLRRRKLETEALDQLQAPRKQAAAARRDMQAAVELFLQADRVGNRFVPQLFGFEFSEWDVEEEVDKLIFKHNKIGKANGMSEEEYEEQYWLFCGQYYPDRDDDEADEEAA